MMLLMNKSHRCKGKMLKSVTKPVVLSRAQPMNEMILYLIRSVAVLWHDKRKVEHVEITEHVERAGEVALRT